MPRPIQAIIHGAALRHNLARLRAAGAGARLFAVVKANAYGHGIERVFGALRGADGFAVLDLDEARRLRALDWRGPVLLLEGAFEARDLELCSRLDLWPVVHCDEQIAMLAAHKTGAPLRVFLKMNSGMNRLGFAPARYRAAWARLDALPQVGEVSLLTHFSDADGPRGIAHQLALFDGLTRDLPGERCLANSAGLLRHGGVASADWVRAGIALYGSAPDHPEGTLARWDLRPAMTLATRIVAVQSLEAGASVGYGSTFVAPMAMRIGIAAAGYADGYPRHAPGDNAHGTPVLVAGQRSRTVGRVSMDMIAVDLSALPEAGLGTEVTLWGRAGNGALLPIDEVAHAAGTIGYEPMCALAARVPVTLDEEDEPGAG